MLSARISLSLPFVATLALVIAVISPAPSHAQKTKPPAPAKNKAKHGPAVSAAMRFQEAQLLRHAYIKLAGANHDYNGHRVLAMQAIHRAIRILDEGNMKTSNARLKSMTAQAQAAMAQAAAVAKQAAPVHQGQAYSDLQLRRAARILLTVANAAAKQPIVLKHVTRAIKEIQMSLATN